MTPIVNIKTNRNTAKGGLSNPMNNGIRVWPFGGGSVNPTDGTMADSIGGIIDKVVEHLIFFCFEGVLCGDKFLDFAF